MTERCKDCEYWYGDRDSETPCDGKCIRYPPEIVFFPRDAYPTYMHPFSNSGAWCGEWKKFEEAG